LRRGKIDCGGVRFEEAKLIHHHPLINFNLILEIQLIQPQKENEEKHVLFINLPINYVPHLLLINYNKN